MALLGSGSTPVLASGSPCTSMTALPLPSMASPSMASLAQVPVRVTGMEAGIELLPCDSPPTDFNGDPDTVLNPESVPVPLLEEGASPLLVLVEEVTVNEASNFPISFSRLMALFPKLELPPLE